MFKDRDSMETLIAECVEAEFRQFQHSLELRIVNVLRMKDVFPQPVVLSIGSGISQRVSDMLVSEVFKSGVMHDELMRLL